MNESKAIARKLVAQSIKPLVDELDGDLDSTGSIAGNLLGALHGWQVIPTRWADQAELRQVIVEIAGDLRLCRVGWHCRRARSAL